MAAPKEQSTRQLLMTLLKTNGKISVSFMAQELGITEMAVRRHLAVMEQDGLLQTELSRKGMGRPMTMYSLSDHADHLFPKNYHKLTLDLLEELDAEEGDDVVSRLFDSRKRKLFKKYRPQLEGKSLDDKVETLAQIQEDNGYMVKIERDRGGRFVLEEYNCPIAEVAKRYQDACRCEKALFEDLLEVPVERTECLTKGDRKCKYIIHSDGR